MTEYDDTDLVVEQQLQEHYQERYGQPLDVASFWTQLSPQLEGRNHPLSRRQRFFGSMRRSLSFQKETAFAPEISYEKMHNQRTRRIGVWAAALLAFMLVGSMALVFSMIAQKKHADGGTAAAAKGPDVPGIYITDVKGMPGGADKYVTTLSRLDAKSHILLWQRSINNMNPTLVASEDSVYGTTIDINATKDRSAVVALNLNNGSIRWDTEVGSPDFLSGLAVTDKDVYVMSDIGKIYVLDRATGKTHRVVDTKQLGAQLTPSVSIVNGVAYGSTSDAFVAIDTITSTLLWSRPKDKALQTGVPIVIGDTVYMSADGDSGLGAEEKSWGFAYAFDAKSGVQKWAYRVNARITDPTLANGRVLFGAADGNIYALNAKSGEKVWQYRTNRANVWMLVVVDGKVYYREDGPPIGTPYTVTIPAGTPSVDTTASLVVLDLATGKKLWSLHMDVKIDTRAVKDDTFYVGAAPHQVEALSASDGKVLWRLDVGNFVTGVPDIWLVG